MSVYVGIDVHRKRSQVAVLPALQPSFQEHRSDCKPGLNSSGERAQFALGAAGSTGGAGI